MNSTITLCDDRIVGAGHSMFFGAFAFGPLVSGLYCEAGDHAVLVTHNCKTLPVLRR